MTTTNCCLSIIGTGGSCWLGSETFSIQTVHDAESLLSTLPHQQSHTLLPKLLEAWSIGNGWLSWSTDCNCYRNRKVDTHHCYLTLFQVGEKSGCRAIQLPTRALDNFSIPIMGKSVHQQCAHLTQYALYHLSVLRIDTSRAPKSLGAA